MSSFIFGAGMLSTLHQLAPWNLLQTNYKTLNLSLKRLWNKPTLWDGSCFGGKRHKLSVQGHKTPQEWQGWGYFGDISAHSSALIGPCPRVAMCHPSLVFRAHLSWSLLDTDRGLCLQSGLVSEENLSQKCLSLILPALSPPQVPYSLPEDPQLASGCQEGGMAKNHKSTRKIFPVC